MKQEVVFVGDNPLNANIKIFEVQTIKTIEGHELKLIM